MNIGEELELITSLISQDSEFSKNLIKAKDYFFQICGRTYPGDENYKTRMDCFLNWFLFDWKFKNDNPIFKNIIVKFGVEYLQPFHYQFHQNIHSIFRFLKEQKRGYLIIDLFTKKKYILEKDFYFQEMEKNSCFETRVFIISEKFFLSNYIIIHPLKANRYIQKIVKDCKNQIALKEVILQLHKKYFKWHTYKHFNVNQIYDD